MKWNVANTFRKQKKTPLITGSPPSRHGSASHATVVGRLCPEGGSFRYAGCSSIKTFSATIFISEKGHTNLL
ncbi:hypothetical protein [Brevibacillus sp. CF112]|uniref:hypothetical protein n=1 Tax=Brevibacillus agri TaxID=51101 RepID=UPI00055717A1